MKIIDLSTAIADRLPVDPGPNMAHIKYMNHYTAIPEMLAFFPGATCADLPDEAAWAFEELQISTHTGSHMDAPWHYHPTMNGGERAWTIDEIPLEWCISDGVMVDFSDKPDGYVCTSQDFENYLDKINYTIKPGDIVLIHTSAPLEWGNENYLKKGCGVGREGTLWLTKQGVRVVGTDAWSWDAPLPLIADKFKESGDNKIIWEGHKAGMDTIYCHMEKLCNLDKLPPVGFKVIALPIKIQKASAGWVRAVAIL